MKEFQEEYPGLEIWNRRGEKNSFYTDMEPLKRFNASSHVLGDLNRYSYCLDSESHNIIQIRNK